VGISRAGLSPNSPTMRRVWTAETLGVKKEMGVANVRHLSLWFLSHAHFCELSFAEGNDKGGETIGTSSRWFARPLRRTWGIGESHR